MMSNYLGDQCAGDLLGCAIPRTNSGLRIPVNPNNRNVLLPPSAEETWGLGDAWGGVTELSDTHNDLVYVRAGNYVNNAPGGLFRRRLRLRRSGEPALMERDQVVGGGDGPIYGDDERDEVLVVPRS